MARGGMSKAKDGARRAAREARPWIGRVARFGYAAYGVVYVLVGVLAFRAALGGGGEAAGQEGALQTILLAPLGRVLLGLVALGLLGYAVWRLFQGVLDPENEGRDAKGVVKRSDHVVNGLFHVALAVSVGGVALGSGGGGGGGPDDWTATLLRQPLGRYLTVAAGVGIVAIGLFQFYRAYDAKFMEKLKPGEMGPAERTWTRRAGRLGHAARGVVFCVMGVFLVQAALRFDPSRARGLGGALSALASQPFGPYLLGAVAAGLACFGLFMFVVARYRRIETG
ncbi:DUF1206 domain-containing protein [Rubrobacter tropicus]|uniref:DUF1206 domain-containing protein n=1 Tax=Rubrobacter tropicus TaxID=2653851 RepID=A0A6G8Q593_9ACTN|nr:DUF1206 domain-containing protein [Rubrobacter tropicus]QIN81645.1 DUF1206 domain-containing protein [Rubrobacter tropicus]